MILLIMLSSLLPNISYHEGIASYYSNEESGNETASGEIFDDTQNTCAMLEGNFDSYCLILGNNRATICRLTDRGPYISGRIIDLSKKAMQDLKGIKKGLIPVKVYRLSWR